MGEPSGISVIAPIAEGDDAWRELLADLIVLDSHDEVVLSTCEALDKVVADHARNSGLRCSVRCIRSKPGRAKQLNAGARVAVNPYLWFLHADSRLSSKTLASLRDCMSRMKTTIHFFDLSFADDGPWQMRSNVVGGWFRSRVLRLPFGDQGFCMRRDIFVQLGEFNEAAPYGEDHLFVWKAHQERIPLNCVGVPLRTSARRYQTHGWWATTSRHLRLTALQAGPELVRLIGRRISL